MNHKTIVTDFQKLIISGHIREAYEKYVSPDFIHHNPYFPGDRESLLVGMEENQKEFPDKIFETQRLVEDGDLVVAHSRLRMKSDMPEIITVHIFRFENDLIAEEWDVGQPVPEDCPNKNGAF